MLFLLWKRKTIFKFFDIIGEKNMDHVNYKDSLLANMFSQIELVRSELKEKNFIRNLLNRMKSNNCIILPNVQFNKGYEHSVETSTSHSLLNSDVTETQNLIDLSDDTNYQDSNTTIDTQKSDKKCSSIPSTNGTEMII